MSRLQYGGLGSLFLVIDILLEDHTVSGGRWDVPSLAENLLIPSFPPARKNSP